MNESTHQSTNPSIHPSNPQPLMDEFKRQLAVLDALNQARNDFQKTMLLLGALKAGTVTLDQIVLTNAGGWQILNVEIEQPSS
jgi:hypothetical protein